MTAVLLSTAPVKVKGFRRSIEEPVSASRGRFVVRAPRRWEIQFMAAYSDSQARTMGSWAEFLEVSAVERMESVVKVRSANGHRSALRTRNRDTSSCPSQHGG